MQTHLWTGLIRQLGRLLLVCLISPWPAVAPVLADAPAGPVTQAVSKCPPLPPPAGTIVNVSTVTQLISAVNTATAGTTILVAEGTYTFGSGDYLQMDVPNVTIRSAGGDRESVILDGNYRYSKHKPLIIQGGVLVVEFE